MKKKKKEDFPEPALKPNTCIGSNPLTEAIIVILHDE